MKSEELDELINKTKETLDNLLLKKRKLGASDNEQLLIDFGVKIKKIREEKKLSQEEFAFLTDVSRGYISKVENGLLNPSYIFFIRMLVNLDLSSEQILYFVQDTINQINEEKNNF